MPFSPKWIRRVRRLLLAGGVLVTLLLVAGLALHLYGRHEWKQVIADYAARGQPLDQLPEPGTLPPERNFYQTPALADLLFKQTTAITVELVERGFSRGLVSASAQSAIGQELDLAKLAPVLGGTVTEATPAKLRATLAPAAPVLDELRRAARERPESQLTRPAGVRMQDFSFPTPSFLTLHFYATALAVEARLALIEGRADLALDNTRALLALTGGLFYAPDNLLFDPLMGEVLTPSALAPVWDGLSRGRWSEADLRELDAHLPRHRPVDSLSRGAGHERTLALRVIGVGGPVEGTRLRSVEAWVFAIAPYLPRGWIDWQNVGVVACYEPMVALAAHTHTPRFRLAVAAMQQTNMRGARNRLASIIVPTLGSVITSVTRCEADLDLARAAIAIERYRLAHDRLPSALDELVPAYLSSVPTDVMDGAPLRYRRDDDGRGFVLYSVGTNGVDDGGKPPKGGSTELFSAEAEGDWVWPRYQRPGASSL